MQKLYPVLLLTLISTTLLASSDPVQQVNDFAKQVGGIEAPACINCNSVKHAIATVLKINKKTRVITFKNEAGKVTDYKAPPSVRNFDQIKVGDVVTIIVTTDTDIQVTKGALETKMRTIKESLTKARLGSKPGVKLKKEVINQAKIVDKDYTSKAITLESMHGQITIIPKDVEHFRLLRVGDIVDSISNETVEINITAPAAPTK